jgi:ankyrin repeat protein
MTDSNLELTPEEQEAFSRDNKMMEVLRQANQNSGTSFQELFPNAIPVSELQYWAPIDRPDARAKLKQALSSGSDVNEKSDGDYTPLHGAAENGVLENVKLLIANGADVTAQLSDGKTPLDLAKAQGHADVVAFLESQSKN